MRSCHSLDRFDVTFDDEHLVANAGLMLPATLAQHLGVGELLDRHVDLGDAPGRANVGHKAMTLIHSALAGGDSIDDADALRAGDTQSVLGHTVLAPSTLGTFLRSFSWGHARQLDKASGELLARAWAAGAGPGDHPFTIDVDSSIHETYGLAKHGGTKFTYNHVRGYHPLYAVGTGTGDVLHTRLRGGNAHAGRGAASFLTETFGRVRAAGATGALVVRADSGFYSRNVVDACVRSGVGYSITAKLHKGGVSTAIAAIDESAWTPIPYFLDGADVAETTYRPFGTKGTPCRLIVRRVRPTPGSQLALGRPIHRGARRAPWHRARDLSSRLGRGPQHSRPRAQLLNARGACSTRLASRSDNSATTPSPVSLDRETKCHVTSSESVDQGLDSVGREGG
jgi:hypothetical protein